MGFASSSCSFTRFKIVDPVPDNLFCQLTDKLVQYSFRDIDDLPEMRSIGWVNFDDMLDSSWSLSPPQKGDLIFFSLRMDTRRIPPAVFKKHFSLAILKEKNEMQNKERKFISRERKKEIKEQVLLRLRQKFLPIPAIFDVIWIIEKNEIWFFSLQSKMIDLFMDEFLKTFGLHIEPFTPFNLAADFLDEENILRLEALQETIFAQ